MLITMYKKRVPDDDDRCAYQMNTTEYATEVTIGGECGPLIKCGEYKIIILSKLKFSLVLVYRNWFKQAHATQ